MDRRTKATLNREKAIRLNEAWGVGATKFATAMMAIGMLPLPAFPLLYSTRTDTFSFRPKPITSHRHTSASASK
jgi:hypothetical protein